MKKGYSRRFFAAFLAAAMLMSQGSFSSFAEEGIEQAPVMETVAEPETPAPAPEPETPAPEPETPAPQPETPAPEAETPAPAATENPTETPTEPSTAVPAEAGTENAAPQSEQAASEASTEPKTEKQTEAQTEEQTEESTEKKDKTILTGKFDGGSITVTLSEGDAVTQKGRLKVRQISEGSDPSVYNACMDAIKAQTDKGHRELAGGMLYRLTLKDQGEVVVPQGPVRVEINYNAPLSLGLIPYHLEETALYSGFSAPGAVGGSIALNGDLCAVAVSYEGAWTSELTVAGICDHINDGSPVTSGQIRAHVNNLPSGYYAAAGSAEGAGNVPVGIVTVAGINAGTQKEPAKSADDINEKEDKEDKEEEKAEESAAENAQQEGGQEESSEENKEEKKEQKTDKKNLPDAGAVSGGLADLAAYSVQLANAVNGGDVLVVNVYANADGSIDWTPLTPALNEDGSSIEVTYQMVLINIVAYTPGQALSIPMRGVKDQATGGAAYSAEDAVKRKGGRVIYNFVSQGEETSPSVFAGSISLEGAGTGMFLAPAATLNIASGLRGSAYAGTLIVSDGTEIAGCLIGDDPVLIRQAEAAAKAEQEKKAREEEEKKKAGTEEAAGEQETEALSEEQSGAPQEDVTERPDVVLVGIGAESDDEDETEQENAKVLSEAEADLALTMKVVEGETPVADKQGFSVKVTYTKVDEAGTETEGSFDVADLATNEEGILSVKPLVGEGKIASLNELKWTEETPAEGEEVTAWTADLTAVVTLPAAYAPADGETLSVPYVIKRTEKPAEEPTAGSGEGSGTPAVEYDYTAAPKEEGADQIDVVSKTGLTVEVSVVETGKTEQLQGAEFSVTLGDKELEGVKLVSGGDDKNEITLYLEDHVDDTKVKDFLDKLKSEDKTQTGTLPVKVTQTKTVLFYDFADPDFIEATVSTTDYDQEGEGGEITRTHEAEMHAFEFKLNPTKLTLTAHSDVAGAACTDQTGAAYASDQAQTYVLKDTEPFRSAITEQNPSTTVWVRETTVPTGYICTNPEQTVTASINDKGVITWDGVAGSTAKTVNFTHVKKELTVTVQAIAGGKGVPATFEIRDSAGTVLTTITSTAEKAATAVLENVASVTVVQTGVAANYVIVGPAQQVKTEGTDYNYDPATGVAECSVVFNNATAATTTESIRVRKEWYVGDNNRVYNASNNGGVTFYLALFSDKAKTNRVSAVYPVTAAKGNPYKTKTIGHLPAGTYYVAETDAAGVPITSNSEISSVTYGTDADGKVTIRNSGSTIHNVTVKNHYYSLPSGFQYLGQVGIRKQILTANGELDTTFDGSVKVQIRYTSGGKTLAQTKTLAVSKGKSSYYVYYVPLGNEPSKDVTVYEAYTGTNGKTYYAADGKRVRLGEKIYNVSISSPTVTVAAAQTTTPLVTVANKVQTSDQSGEKESETNKDASQAVLKLTKKVTYKGQPIRVNSGYYIGIFDDAGLTKLRYKKALAFKNASEVTASLKINLYKLKSKEVTFYFAEVDKDGKPVQSGTALGYNVSQNKQSITLNEKNLEDEVIITNDVVSGSRREQALTDPRSGFAGSASAAAEAAALSTSEDAEQAANSSARTKTGDETPIALYVGLLAAALVIILAAVLLIRRRRK